MTMQPRKASRKKARLRLGIAAPSGAGKTMGALLLAYGITGDWDKIGLVDTEAGSGELYVGETADTPDGPIKIGEYNYIRIDPPFTVAKYLEAIRAFEKSGVSLIITDSLSHAWAGQGGLLDKQGKVADRIGNSYTAWREVTPEHNSLVEMILQSSCHMICTMRSKTEYVLETNEKGKQQPKKVGMAPVQRDGMEYEFTVFLDIDHKHIATASKDRTNRLKGQYFQIAPSVGKTMLDWLDNGIDETQMVIEAFTESKSLEELNEAKATKLNPLWPRLGQADRERVQKIFTERKAVFVPAEATPTETTTPAAVSEAPAQPAPLPEAEPAPVATQSAPPVKTNGATPPATGLQGKLERAGNIMAAG